VWCHILLYDNYLDYLNPLETLLEHACGVLYTSLAVYRITHEFEQIILLLVIITVLFIINSKHCGYVIITGAPVRITFKTMMIIAATFAQLRCVCMYVALIIKLLPWRDLSAEFHENRLILESDWWAFATTPIRQSSVPALGCVIGKASLCTFSFYKGSVRIVAGYGLDGRGSITGRSKKCFSTPQHSDQLWDPPSLLSNGYRGALPGGKEAGAWSWVSYLVPTSVMVYHISTPRHIGVCLIN
jgi:hypothetical protein